MVWAFSVPAEIDNMTSSSDTIVREGDTVKLTCVATGVPEPDIKWFRKTLQNQQATERKACFVAVHFLSFLFFNWKTSISRY